MQKSIIAFCLCMATVISSCQPAKQITEFNFGFEKIAPGAKLPEDWFDSSDGYSLKIDTVVRKNGRVAILIEPVEPRDSSSFGGIMHQIPAIYKAKEIEVRAALKYNNVSDGFVGLMVRVDGVSSQLGFDDMREKQIQGTSDWKIFSVKIPYPEKATMIYIGPILSGNGQLWADDFQVFLDGREIHKAKLLEPIEYQADKDKEFDSGSGISALDLSASNIEDLVTLGKVWGFLKYYHPAVAIGKYNWDYELFRMLPDMLETKDPEKRNVMLEKWVGRLGNMNKDNAIKEDTVDIKMVPDLAWIDHQDLGESLTKKLVGIKSAKRASEHYYIGLTQYVGNPVFKNERSCADMKYPDAGFRLLSLYRYWNIIEYYFPYKNLIEEDWDEVLKEFIPKFVNASNELEYKMAVLALIARVHDTHANIWGQDSTLRSFRGKNYAPLEIKFIEHSAIVTDYIDDAMGEASGLLVGDMIETINRVPVETIIKTKLPFTPASNYPTQLRDIARDLLRTNDTIMALGILRENERMNLMVRCYNSKEMNPYKKYMDKDTCFKHITPDIAYVYPGTIKNEYWPHLWPEIENTKGLIIDLRCYPSAFIVFSLSEYLQPEQTDFVKFSIGSVTTPGLFTMTDRLKVGKTNKDHYKGKVVILINEKTQSQAEYTTMALRTTPGAVVIGSTTAGADGNVSQFYLPGGINTMISGIGVYYPDGRETQRVGIVPDIEVKPTIKGIQEGRDEVLERAIAIINEN